jgi:hypothetical protein
VEDHAVSRVNSPSVPAPLQANPTFAAASPDLKPAADKPRTLGGVAVWIVLVVGLLVVADLLVARTGHVWTAVTIGLLGCVFLAFLVVRRPAETAALAKDDSATEKPKQV